MKKYYILFALLFCLVGSILAQPAPMNKKMVKAELMNALKGLDLEGLKELYMTATDKLPNDLSKKAMLKSIKKAAKKMPLGEQIDLLDYAKDVAQNGVIYPVIETNPVAPSTKPVPPANLPKEPVTAPKFQDAPITGPTTTIEFEQLEFDFGTIEQGEKVTHTFKFTNTGKASLLIFEAKGSCGCTVPEWTKKPIAPGKSGEITVTFNSKGKKNKRRQKVTLKANTEPMETFIYLKGFVNAPETPASKN